MNCYEAASGGRGLVVSVGRDGASLRVQLSAAAMELADEELVARIVRLNTLAYLRRQLDISQEMPSDHAAGLEFLPSAQQVAAYSQTIDF